MTALGAQILATALLVSPGAFAQAQPKHGLRADALPAGVRTAGAADVPGIVKLSVEHRRTLARRNARFWHIHPEADSRFDAWMRRSLTFSDHGMLVAGLADALGGYVIAQPCPPLLVPIAHDVAGIGAIDDSCDADFTNVPALSDSGSSGGEPAGCGRKRVCATRCRQRAGRLPCGMVVQDHSPATAWLPDRQALDAEAQLAPDRIKLPADLAVR